jgi:hypothetical protein
VDSLSRCGLIVYDSFSSSDVPLKRDLFLLAFCYISKSFVSRKAQIGKSISEIGLEGSYPSCTKDCLNGKEKNKCAPRNGREFPFTKDGLLRAHLLQEVCS